MSKEDIEKAVKEAEQYAAEDKKRREEIDVRNGADQMVYQCEKTLTDLGDKIDAADKADVQAKVDALKEALKGTDLEAIKSRQDELQKKFYEVSSKVYQADPSSPVEAAGGAAPGAEAPHDDNVVDADYKEVDEDQNK